MPHFVFANDNEIASKSADGISPAAFPDVCISPGPPPPPGGIPIPYPNTCFAKDLTKVSKTVFIKKKGAALENKSYFSKSTGDEPATLPLKKGVVSGNITGKCFFQSWSMNVKIEGKGVARHMDLVSHNHGSPGNILTNKYISVFKNSPDCKKDRDRIAKACKPKPPEKKKKKGKKSIFKTLGNLASFPDNAAKAAYGKLGYKPNAANKWVEDYCDGLWIKPTAGTERFKEAQEKINELLEIAQSKTKIMQRALDEIWSLAQDSVSTWFLVKQGLKLGGKALVKNLIGGAAATTGIGTVITAGMAAWTVSDVISTATTIAQKVGPEALQHIEDLKNMDQLQEKAAQLAKEYKENPSKAMADLQTVIAAANPCLRARKCQLVPYNKTDALDAAKKGQGCCPGQTGHHVLPDAMFKGKKCYGGHGAAPTICLEGANNSHGSHGKAHSNLFKSMEQYRKSTGKDKMSYPEARDRAVEAVPAPYCSKKCLKAQLDAFYEKCKNEKVDAIAGSHKDGTLPGPTPGGGGSFGN